MITWIIGWLITVQVVDEIEKDLTLLTILGLFVFWPIQLGTIIADIAKGVKK